VRALAFLCFRDNIVRYKGEMTADDMKHMFSPEHLVRTEISTLMGLTIKADIDYSLPDPAVTQHRAIAASPLVGVDLQEAVKKGINPFATGDAFREATTKKGISSARTVAARKSSSVGPPSTQSRRRKAPHNRICGPCTNPGQLTLLRDRRRLVAFQQNSHRRAQGARRSFHPFHQTERSASHVYESC
jgi:hypothetical protein